MSEHDEEEPDAAKGPASDRVIPHGTDEHSDENGQQEDDRTAATSPSRPAARDEPDRDDVRRS